MAEPTLYLFDGFNLLHAGGFGSPEGAARPSRELGRRAGARGVLVFDGEGKDEEPAR